MSEITRMPNHKIINVNSRYPLDIEGTEIYVNEDANSSSQCWDLIAEETSPDVVRIRSRKDRREFIGLRGDEVCLVGDAPGDANQRWVLIRERENYYELVNQGRRDRRNENSLLEVPKGSTDPGSKVGVWKDVNMDHQRWELSPSRELTDLKSDLTGRLKTLRPQNCQLEIMLVIQGASKIEGHYLCQWVDVAYNLFEFRPVDDEEDSSWHGFYRIISRNSGMAITAPAPGDTNKRIKQYSVGRIGNQGLQLWWVEPFGDNYLIINKATNQPIESKIDGPSDRADDLGSPLMGAGYNPNKGVTAGQTFKIVDAHQ